MTNADADESSNEGSDESWAAGLDVLLDLMTSVIEETHEVGAAAVAPDPDAELQRIAVLRQAGSDLSVLASACEVLVRRQQRH